jgi:hypothetical protein
LHKNAKDAGLHCFAAATAPVFGIFRKPGMKI